MGDLSRPRLYNTRTRTVEQLVPLRDDEVRIYVCGMTPSAEAHLGHARSFLFFDILRRYLEHRGYTVTYVQNVTDVDDRSIAEARERGTTYDAVVRGYYASFKASMQRLGVREPDEEPYATAYIAQIQTMIRELIEKKYAYVVEDGVYYSVRTFPRYGELSRRNIEELEAGARIEVGEYKRDPLDFALWKFAKEGEPSWPFDPYRAGRPGWHIECSAMSRALLDAQGLGFDIHGGGADLIFPHHENEIAQSEPLMVRPPMANVWIHGGLLLFDNRKMSKSLGNFEPLSHVLDRHDPQAIRLLFLQTGYRKVMNFTEDSIAGAGVVLDRLKKTYRVLKMSQSGRETGLLRRIDEALADDMNTAVALSALLQEEAPSLDEFERALMLLGIEPNDSWIEEPTQKLPRDFIERLKSALGPSTAALRAYAEDENGGVTAEALVERVIKLRNDARAAKDWGMSDRLRDALLASGVALHDTKEGTTWSVAD